MNSLDIPPMQIWMSSLSEVSFLGRINEEFQLECIQFSQRIVIEISYPSKLIASEFCVLSAFLISLHCFLFCLQASRLFLCHWWPKRQKWSTTQSISFHLRLRITCLKWASVQMCWRVRLQDIATLNCMLVFNTIHLTHPPCSVQSATEQS